tara:strand:- start:1149 stop:1781 length:633 start_codon:yes stop_codon:yes gene_type:complete
MTKSLIIACDGEAASGKSTGAKLISRKYKLLLVNSGLLYRYASKLIIENNPKKKIPFLKKKFKKINYKKISKLNLHTQKIDEIVGPLAKIKNIRDIMKSTQRNLIKNNKRICLEGRDIASTILKKNPKYDIAFYFKCNLNISAYRRWIDLKKKIPLKDVKKSLQKRSKMDKERYHSPLIKVKDAILIRTDSLNKVQMIKKMSNAIDKKFN